MAVVQISRIQIRRGSEEGVLEGNNPIVRLASGELAWAIKDRKLFIGGGSEEEGAPKEENVEILTQYSNIYEAVKYVYKNDTDAFPRDLQDRLDDRLNSKNYNIVANTQDLSNKINFAIEKIYKNSLGTNSENPELREILEFSPGIYIITDPIKIYSYTKIIGAGPGRTIFRYQPTDPSRPAFIFVDDVGAESLGTQSSDLNQQTSNLNQCRYVHLENFTLEVKNSETPGLDLYCVANSQFKNIDIIGEWQEGNTGVNSLAVKFKTKSLVVNCNNNIFENIKILKFKTAIEAQGPISNNRFNNIRFESLDMGVVFGYSQIAGPRQNIIENCVFEKILKQGIKVYNGFGNVSTRNKFIKVGNNGLGVDQPEFGQIEYDTPNNITTNDYFDRHQALVQNSLAYVSEVTGKAFYNNNYTYTVSLSYSPDIANKELFRLPLPTSSTPLVGPSSCVIEIDYLYQSTGSSVYNRIRKGKLTALLYPQNSGTISKVNLIDEYDYLGKGMSTPEATDQDEFIEFKSIVELKNNKWQLRILYKYNVTPGPGDDIEEQGIITYNYRFLS